MANYNGTVSIRIKEDVYSKLKGAADKSGISYGKFADAAILDKVKLERRKKKKLEKEISIEGCVNIPKTVSESDFWSEFISWIEASGYKFGGGVNEVKK